jgi:hypothetical protein
MTGVLERASRGRLTGVVCSGLHRCSMLHLAPLTWSPARRWRLTIVLAPRQTVCDHRPVAASRRASGVSTTLSAKRKLGWRVGRRVSSQGVPPASVCSGTTVGSRTTMSRPGLPGPGLRSVRGTVRGRLRQRPTESRATGGPRRYAEVVGRAEQRDLLALLGQPESGEHRRLAVPEDGDLARLGSRPRAQHRHGVDRTSRCRRPLRSGEMTMRRSGRRPCWCRAPQFNEVATQGRGRVFDFGTILERSLRWTGA